MSKEENPLKIRQNLRQKTIDLLAQRDHSEKELREKLKEKFSSGEDLNDHIDEAVEHAKNQNWLKEPSALSEQFANSLHRRLKGILYINNFLSEKGLPSISKDLDLELEKALAVVATKIDNIENTSPAEKARLARFLNTRGFDSETVRKVLYEKL